MSFFLNESFLNDFEALGHLILSGASFLESTTRSIPVYHLNDQLICRLQYNFVILGVCLARRPN